MPSKIKPIPLRLPDDLKGQVLDHSRACGLSQQGALIDLIRQGLGAEAASSPPKGLSKAAKAPSSTPRAASAPVKRTKAEAKILGAKNALIDEALGPDPKAVLERALEDTAHLAAPKPKLDTSMVQVGRTEPPKMGWLKPDRPKGRRWG